MVVGAVAEILENMAAVGEWRLANPVRAFTAHLREAECLAVHPLRHVMAADTGVGAAALRHTCRRIVRTARTEVRDSLGDVGRFRERPLRGLQTGHMRRELV